MKNSILIIFVFALTLFSNCDSDDAPITCEPITNPYQNCCGTAPLEAVLGTGEIFIPNILTPNFDGNNDRLFLFTNNDITSIKSFILKNESGQEIFQLANVITPSSLSNPENSWDGTDGQGNILNGLFDYEITVINVDNEEATFTGKACSIDCQEAVVPSENINNCGFPTQHNGEGNLDLNLPNGEPDCF